MALDLPIDRNDVSVSDVVAACMVGLATGGTNRALWAVRELDARVMLESLWARPVHELFESCHAAVWLLRLTVKLFRSCMQVCVWLHKGILNLGFFHTAVLEAESDINTLQ